VCGRARVLNKCATVRLFVYRAQQKNNCVSEKESFYLKNERKREEKGATLSFFLSQRLMKV
jgi:hypothetical protein